MFNLPPELIRYIFKLLLEMEPLYIFKFPDEWFKIGEYEEKEIIMLILESIEQNFIYKKCSLFTEQNLNYIKTCTNMAKVLTKIPKDDLFENKDLIFGIFRVISEDKYWSFSLPYGWVINLCTSLDLIKWFYSINPKMVLNNDSIINYCLRYNITEIIDWFKTLDKSFAVTSRTFQITIENEDTEGTECSERIERIKWLQSLDLNYSIEKINIYHPLCKGNLKMVRFLVSQNCLVNEPSFYKIIEMNDLDLLKFIFPYYFYRNRKLNIYYSTCIKNKNLEMLDFLMKNENKKLPLTEECCYEAIRNNDLEMLKWLRSQNPPCHWRKGKCLKLCSNNKEIQSFVKETYKSQRSIKREKLYLKNL